MCAHNHTKNLYMGVFDTSRKIVSELGFLSATFLARINLPTKNIKTSERIVNLKVSLINVDNLILPKLTFLYFN